MAPLWKRKTCVGRAMHGYRAGRQAIKNATLCFSRFPHLTSQLGWSFHQSFQRAHVRRLSLSHAWLQNHTTQTNKSLTDSIFPVQHTRTDWVHHTLSSKITRHKSRNRYIICNMSLQWEPLQKLFYHELLFVTTWLEYTSTVLSYPANLGSCMPTSVVLSLWVNSCADFCA